jgi:hypothetical protein
MELKILTSEPTKEQILGAYIKQLEKGNEDVTETWVARRLWAGYLVNAMRKARTFAELLDLHRTGTMRGMMAAFDMFSGETPRQAAELANERLNNTFWTDGKKIYQVAEGKLAPNLEDARLAPDLEQAGFIAFDRGELKPYQVSGVERTGMDINIEGWLAGQVIAYHTASPRYIPADKFVCAVCKHSTVMKDYGDEYRATCDRGWPLDLDADPVTCPQLEEPEEGTWA